MAHKKGVGSTDNGRDSNPKYLGVKLFGGQSATAGNIIVRQRGTKFHPGDNVYMGRDYTLHAKVDGTVVYRRRKNNRTYVSILPNDAALAADTRPIVNTKAAASSFVAQPAKPKAAAPKRKASKPKPSVAPSEAAVEAQLDHTEAELPRDSVTPPGTDLNKIATPSEEVSQQVATPIDEAKVNETKPKASEKDDLKKIEGVGPKIEGLLNEGGFYTFAQVAEGPVEKIQEILDAAGPRYRIHKPATWSKQAALARDGKWDELATLQDELKGGKE